MAWVVSRSVISAAVKPQSRRASSVLCSCPSVSSRVRTGEKQVSSGCGLVLEYVIGLVHPDHLGTHVAEHHRAPGAGTDRRDLDDLHALKRAHLSPAFSCTCPS
jgi:hypothetical protein